MLRRSEFDGFRGLAVLLVLLFHAEFLFFDQGYVGVDIFFVLSGYFIFSKLLTADEGSSFSLLDFYFRRFRRIIPAYFLMLVVTGPFFLAVLLPSNAIELSKMLVANLFFCSNYFISSRSGYFDVLPPLKPYLHLWSLSVEVQFYLLAPLIVILAKRFKNLIGRMFFYTLFVLSFAYFIHSHLADRPGAYFNFIARYWEFALGGIAAEISNRWSLTRPSLGKYGTIGILISISPIFISKFISVQPLYSSFLAAFGTFLMVLFRENENLFRRTLQRGPLLVLGTVSYSLYLWHQPIFTFFGGFDPNAKFNFVIVFLLIAMTVSFSWVFIEKKFTKIERFNFGSYSYCLGLIFVCLLGLGWVGIFSDGFLYLKFNQSQISILRSAKSSPKRAACHTQGLNYLTPDNSCKYFFPESEWAVMGNSSAVEIAFSLAEELRVYNQGVMHFTFSGCLPTYGREDELVPGCSDWTNQTAKFISENHKIRTVVLSFRTHRLWRGSGLRPMSEIDEKRWKSYVDLATLFIRSKKRVIVVLQVPEFPETIESLVAKNPNLNSNISGISRAAWRQSYRYELEKLGEFQKAVQIFNPEEIFCDETLCYAVRSGEALYFDDKHLSIAGARIVARAIIDSTIGPKVR